MKFDLRPWRQMLPIWLPVVILGVVSVGFFFYQTSDSVGRSATLAADIDEFSAEVERLKALKELVVADRREVEELQAGFQDINCARNQSFFTSPVNTGTPNSSPASTIANSMSARSSSG